MQVLEKLSCKSWNSSFCDETQIKMTTALEAGKIILCPDLPFALLAHEKKFLSPAYADKKAKNISLNHTTHRLNGVIGNANDHEELKSMMQRFASQAHHLIKQLFPCYAESLKTGRTSFRPVEIAGRKTSTKQDDTRLHVDAFPASPNHGWRILRVFANINPHGQDRTWRIGEPFVDIAKRFLPLVDQPWLGSALLYKVLRITKSYRTLYDHIMLQIHDKMKADTDYQHSSPQVTIPFAPGHTWIVQTDHVSHAAMAGQYVLEQTFYLPVKSMMNARFSPLRILENLTGKKLV